MNKNRFFFFLCLPNINIILQAKETNSFHFEILFGFSHSKAKFQKVLNKIKINSIRRRKLELRFFNFSTFALISMRNSMSKCFKFVAVILKLNFSALFCVSASDTNTKIIQNLAVFHLKSALI